MEKRSRRKFSAEFKTKVILDVLKERNSVEEIARKYEIHPNQISIWKKEFLSKAANIFASGNNLQQDKKQQEAMQDRLYAQIGQQKVEIDWLKKKLS